MTPPNFSIILQPSQLQRASSSTTYARLTNDELRPDQGYGYSISGNDVTNLRHTLQRSHLIPPLKSKRSRLSPHQVWTVIKRQLPDLQGTHSWR